MGFNESNSSSKMNHSKDEESYHIFNGSTDIYPIVLGVLIILFNGLVHFLMAKSKHLRTTANFFLFSLALSDLLTGLVGIPLFLVCNIVRKNTVCIVASTFLRFTSISTVLHLMAITTDRYLAIIQSLRYYLIVTPRRAYITLAMIWIFSIFTSFIQLVWNNPSNSDVNQEGNKKAEIPYDIFSLVAFFALPLIVMIFVNSRIFYEVVRQSSLIRKNTAPGVEDDTKRRQRREWKAAVIFALMFITYCVCWLPFFIVRFQHNIGDDFFELPLTMEYVFIYLRFVSSLLNPCLYVFGKNDFRHALKRAKNRKNRGNSISKASVSKYSFLKTSSM